MLKLKRLRVERFRSLVRGTELAFSDGINVVLGQNGTGKTTLLELISMVVRSDFSSLAKEEFAIEYELSAGQGEDLIVVVKNERLTLEQRQAPVELAARDVFRSSAQVLGAADRRELFRFDAGGGLYVESALRMDPKEAGTAMDPAFLLLALLAARLLKGANVYRVFYERLGPGGNAHRLDESLDILRRLTTSGDLGGILHRRDDPMFDSMFYPRLIPVDIVYKIATRNEPGKVEYSFDNDDAEFLAQLNQIMGFDSSALRIDVAEYRQDQLRLGVLTFRFWWGDGTFITHDRLSYGQKRLLTFFYYLACNPDIVIADELVNGLHHRWITASIEAIGQRQAFLTSQNPLLLDYVPIPSAEEVRRSFVLCRGEPKDGRPGWIWDNMGEDDASELYQAYEVGVEHVSEILQSRGLW